MSAISTAAIAALKAAPMHVFIRGKVQAVRRYADNTYTRIVTPAADAYSRPSVIEVRSKARFGAVNEEVSFTGQLGGYTRKQQSYTDKKTGEVIDIVPVDMTLDMVEPA